MRNKEFITDKLNLRTRIVLPPMATQKSENSAIGEALIEHYRKYAMNKAIGLIITEHAFVDVQGKADPYQVSFASDDMIPSQQRLTAIVHETNPKVKIIAQINHAGAKASSKITGMQPVSASGRITDEGEIRALTKNEIRELEEKFADAALRVKLSGYDGVELHSAHGYLMNQFYSPLTNKREDEYGPQNIENRLRFLRETIALVREKVGEEFPLVVRLGGSDYQDGGSTIEDAVCAAKLLMADGIDLLDISGGMCGYLPKGYSKPGYFSEMTAAIKAQCKVPVILTGGIETPEQADKLLEEGKADLIGVGRAMIKNHMWGM